MFFNRLPALVTPGTAFNWAGLIGNTLPIKNKRHRVSLFLVQKQKIEIQLQIFGQQRSEAHQQRHLSPTPLEFAFPTDTFKLKILVEISHFIFQSRSSNEANWCSSNTKYFRSMKLFHFHRWPLLNFETIENGELTSFMQFTSMFSNLKLMDMIFLQMVCGWVRNLLYSRFIRFWAAVYCWLQIGFKLTHENSIFSYFPRLSFPLKSTSSNFFHQSYEALTLTSFISSYFSSTRVSNWHQFSFPLVFTSENKPTNISQRNLLGICLQFLRISRNYILIDDRTVGFAFILKNYKQTH